MPQRAPTTFTRAQFLADLTTHVQVVAWTCACLLIPLGLWSVWGLLQHIRGASDPPSFLAIVAAPVLTLAAVFLAGAATVGAVFLLRPLRRWWAGWLLTGYALILAIYGSLTALVLLLYLWLDLNPLHFPSASFALAGVRWSTLLVPILGMPLAAASRWQALKQRPAASLLITSQDGQAIQFAITIRRGAAVLGADRLRRSESRSVITPITLHLDAGTKLVITAGVPVVCTMLPLSGTDGDAVEALATSVYAEYPLEGLPGIRILAEAGGSTRAAV